MTPALAKKLRPFFDRGHEDRTFRFLAKSLKGGRGWGVFDQLHGRFLSDAEVMQLPQVILLGGKITH